MRNIVLFKKGESSWIRYIKKRIKNNLNFLAIAEGPTGIGKSWAMLKVAYDLDPEFDVNEQVAFSFRDLMKIINKFNGQHNNKDVLEPTKLLNKKKYKVCIFDEVQTDQNKREWQNKTHRLFNYLLSTFRHQNIIVLMTSPYADFLDSQAMKLIHAKFECNGWNKKTEKSSIRPKLLQYNSSIKKFYQHSLYVIRNKKVHKLVTWSVSKPPEHLVKPYEKYKTDFTYKLNQKIEAELVAIEEGDTQIKDNFFKIFDSTKKPSETGYKILDCWKENIFNTKEIAKKTNNSERNVEGVLKTLRKNGFLEEIAKDYHKITRKIAK